jgi:hypothetical protein
MRKLVIYAWRRLGVGPKRYDWKVIASNGRTVATSHRQGYNDPGEAQRMAHAILGGSYKDALENVVHADRP